MKVLGIAGSPRFGSNTDILLGEVLKGAESKGAETKLIHVANLSIMACNHCDSCMHTGECPFQDDTQKVYKEIEQADRVVLAAPLQFMGLPSQLKALIDRAQAQWVRKYILKIPPLGDTRERRGLFVSVGGRTGEHLFEPALATVKAFFVSLDIKYAGMVAFSGIEGRAQISDNPEAIREAFSAGEKLVEPATPPGNA
ncbi:MAG: flavodoxin family protein [Dehalococcoidia bacterium]|nr:MAG: flavodoxin family protein [Dehalococcoidia bacterium]